MALKLNRERIGLIGRWLALVLLVAQFGAEIHLYSHPLAESSEKLGAARNCGTCLASSQLQNAVSVASPVCPPVRSPGWPLLPRPALLKPVPRPSGRFAPARHLPSSDAD